MKKETKKTSAKKSAKKASVTDSVFVPSNTTLDKYADVLVNFALNSGKGVKKGEVVRLSSWESARPLYIKVYEKIVAAGGHVIPNYLLDATDRHNHIKYFYENAKNHQLDWTPEHYIKGLVKEIDHEILLIAEADKHSLEGVDTKKIMRRGQAMRLYHDERSKKENRGGFTWTLALYGTEAMAQEAGLSLKEYWGQISRACYLNKTNPIAEWKKSFAELENIQLKLNKLELNKLHVVGEGTDLWITPGEKRKWLGGSGRNIPSFELFLSPDARHTEGHITFDLPLYRYGQIIENVYLEFKKGKVVTSTASKGERALKDMIKTPGANRVGEFSLTDKRFSKINKFMAETLFDENYGGKYGNTHLALGRSYEDSCTGDIALMGQKDFEELGFNFSSVHTDIMQTTDRIVTAHMKDGSEQIIYQKGQFTL